MPALTGGQFNGTLNNLSQHAAPADSRSGDAAGRRWPAGSGRQLRRSPAPSTIYREQGNRMIAVKFGVRGRDLGERRRAKRKKKRPHLFQAPYRAEWSGEFHEMQEAEIAAAGRRPACRWC